MRKTLLLAVSVVGGCLGFGTCAHAQMVIDSLTGPVTQNEINSFKTFMQGQTPPADNTGDAYGHHTGSQRFDALGLMYEVSRDQGILDIYVHWVDTALHARNDPNTGCIAWTGNRDLFWPTGVNTNGTCMASTNGEQGWVISHQAWVAELILRNPSLWNQTVTIGDPFGYGATYLQRAQTYVRELDRTEDTFVLKWFITNNQWRFPAQSTGYDGSTWYTLPFPWNQQWMLNGALIRLANCHMILGDDPARVATYNTIVQTSWNFWQSTDLNPASFQGHAAYTWHYVNQTAPNTSIENTGHAAFDVWGLWMAVLGGSGRFGIDDPTMTKFADTTAYGMDLGTAWAQNIDGTGATQTNLQPQFFLLAKWVPSLYMRIANSDLSNATNTPIYDAGILWTKNSIYKTCWSDCNADFLLSATPPSQTVAAGSATSYNVTVTPSGGFNGTVTLKVSGAPSGATAGFIPSSLSGPAASSSTLNVTNSSPIGSYTLTITATSGNLSHTTTVTLVVNQASSSTTVSSSVNPSVFGQPVTFTATVSSTSATGTVQFQDGGGNLGSPVTVNNGSAIFNTSSLPVGSHNITAIYSGDANFTGSTGSLPTQTVNQTNSSTSVLSSANPSVFGSPVTFTATVSAIAPGVGTPSGTVQFKDGAGNLGAPVTLSNASASSAAISSLTVGVHSITAVYGGDANFNGGTSPVLSQSVTGGGSTVTTTTLAIAIPNATPGEKANSLHQGQTVTVTATVATNAGTPTGAVTLMDNGVQIGSKTLTQNSNTQQLQFGPLELNIGRHSVFAQYSGDSTFKTSSSTPTLIIHTPRPR